MRLFVLGAAGGVIIGGMPQVVGPLEVNLFTGLLPIATHHLNYKTVTNKAPGFPARFH